MLSALLLNLDCSLKRRFSCFNRQVASASFPLFTHIKAVVVLFCRAAMLLLKHVKAHCTEVKTGKKNVPWVGR